MSPFPPVNLDEFPFSKLAYEPTMQSRTRKSRVTFGDNYVETRLNGLNPHDRVWNITLYFENVGFAGHLMNLLEINEPGFVYFTDPGYYVSTGLFNPTKWEVEERDITINSPTLATVNLTLKTYRS
jgi:phage-related protein